MNISRKAMFPVFLVATLFMAAAVQADPLFCLKDGVRVTAGDSDGDGIPDAEDLSPTDASSACKDRDGDLLNDLTEFQIGTDPENTHTDSDGISDGDEYRGGMNPLDGADGLVDSDSDGFLDFHEIRAGTDRNDADSVPLTAPAFPAGRYLFYYLSAVDQLAGRFDRTWTFDIGPAGQTVFSNGTNGTGTATWVTGNHVEVTFNEDFPPIVTFPVREFNGVLNQYREELVFDKLYLFPITNGPNGLVWSWYYTASAYFPDVDVTESRQFASWPSENGWLVISSDLPPIQLETDTAYAAVVPNGDFLPGAPEPLNGGRFHNGPVELLLDSGRTCEPVGTVDGSFRALCSGGEPTYYSIYKLADLGALDFVRVTYETQAGDVVAGRDTLLTEVSHTEWPLPISGYYSWDQGQDFAIWLLNDGTVATPSYDYSTGDWRVFVSGRRVWSMDGDYLRTREYVDEDDNFVTDPSMCGEILCLLRRQRELRLAKVIDDRVIANSWLTFFDAIDNDMDGKLDEAVPILLRRDIRSYTKQSILDLDRDGIADSIDRDDDGDGLPEEWEVQLDPEFIPYFASGQGGSDDPDQDTLTNSQEHRLGTDPLTADVFSTSVLTAAASSVGVMAWHPDSLTFGIGWTDPLTGSGGAAASFPLSDAISDAAVLADQNGNSEPEVAVLDILPEGQPRVVVRDGVTGQFLSSKSYLTPDWEASQLALVPKGDGESLAVLARNRETGEIAVQLRDAATGAFQGNVFFLNPNWTPRQLLVLPPLAGNPGSELGLLATNEAGQIVVMVKDASTNSFIRNVFFLNANWSPVGVAVVEGVSGANGPVVALLARNISTGKLVVMLKEAATNVFVRNLFPLGSNWHPVALKVLPHYGGGTGSPEIGVLGLSESDKPVFQVRDSGDAGFINNLFPLGAAWRIADIRAFPDLDMDGSPEITFLAYRRSDGIGVLHTRDAATDSLLSNGFLP